MPSYNYCIYGSCCIWFLPQLFEPIHVCVANWFNLLHLCNPALVTLSLHDNAYYMEIEFQNLHNNNPMYSHVLLSIA